MKTIDVLINIFFIVVFILLHRSRNKSYFKGSAILVLTIYLFGSIHVLADIIGSINTGSKQIYSMDLGKEITVNSKLNLESILFNYFYIVLAFCILLAWLIVKIYSKLMIKK